MKKIILNKKPILITLAAFIFALGAIHFAPMLFNKQILGERKIIDTLNKQQEAGADKQSGPFKAKAISVEATVLNQNDAEEVNLHVNEEEEVLLDKPKAALKKDKNTRANDIYAVSRIMIQFLQKQDYRKDLESIDQTDLPKEVKEVLDALHHFAENNINNGSSKVIIFPKEGVLDRIIGRFVEVEKTEGLGRINEEYQSISKKLYMLEDYFYSPKFLNETNAHD